MHKCRTSVCVYPKPNCMHQKCSLDETSVKIQTRYKDIKIQSFMGLTILLVAAVSAHKKESRQRKRNKLIQSLWNLHI